MVEAALSARVLLPVPPAMEPGVNLAVTPLGSALTARLMVELSPCSPTVLKVAAFTEPPGDTLAPPALAERVKSGGGSTVSANGWVCTTPPPLAMIVTVAPPTVAPEATVNVRVLVPLPGEAKLPGDNFALTPLGNPLVDNITAALNPFWTAVLSVTDTFPDARLALVGLAVSVKLGAGMVSVSVVLRVSPPPVPVIVTV